MLMQLFNEFTYPGFNKLISELKKEEKEHLYLRIKKQEQALIELLKYSFENVPYYKKIAEENNLNWKNINKIRDLTKLPILSREDVKNNIDKFIYGEHNVVQGRTGGTTGQPLHYVMSNESYFRGRALLYNGWKRAGYKRGDKMLIFAGGSLIPKNNMKVRILERITNIHYESSFGVTDYKLERISNWIFRNKPLYIRGYASSIALLASWFKTNGYKSQNVRACITTSEPLTQIQRNIIKDGFGVEVFDTYGLNDSGASAFECEVHDGLHLDLFRSIIEVCDKDGNPVKENQEGRIIATDLYNYAFPFIRYETGDIAKITYETCSCGNTSPRIFEIKGRQAEILEFKKNSINGNFLTVLLGKTQVEMYKIIQTDYNEVVIHMLYKSLEDQNIRRDKCLISRFFYENAPEVKVIYKIYDNYIRFPKNNNKFKFIINEYKNTKDENA